MRKPLLFSIAISILPLSAALAAPLTVRSMSVQPLAREDRAPVSAHRVAGALALPAANAAAEPRPFAAFPVAGTLGQDVYIPYYVDLQPGPGTLDWNCTHLTFDGHTGIDPYVRSFREEDLGVPVFAALDGTVIAAHGGEPDHNTDANPAAVPNSVTISHGNAQATRYEHLRSDVLVNVGDTVSAGQQIGWIGSSGMSASPHLHFEASLNGVPYEPFAGNCRPGPSYWDNQPQVTSGPNLLGIALSNQPFTGIAPADPNTRTGFFRVGFQMMYLQADLGGLGLNNRYTITLQRPNGIQSTVTGPLTARLAEMLNTRWALTADLDTPGTWMLLFDVNNVRLATVPFEVSNAQLVNHAPNAVNPALSAVGAGDVAVCSAGSPFVADPDFDVVSYRYEWTVNGAVVRTVSSAARTDLLARQFAVPGASISCKVTASDGQLESAPATAFALVSGEGRRRVVRQ